jgi:peptide deformylase
MTNNKIIRLGDPLLRKIADPYLNHEFGTDQIKNTANHLFFMLNQENGLGLAAPQIGISKRAIVFGMDKHPTKKNLDPIPYTVLFNPSYSPTSDICEEDYEGCLSVDTLRGKISRYKSIYYCGYDVDGKLIEREAFDLHARVVQHEIDHLDGIIFLDRITNFSSIGFHDELIKSGVFNLNKIA